MNDEECDARDDAIGTVAGFIIPLIKKFQDQDTDTIEQGDDKDPFKGLRFIKMHIDGKQQGIGEQRESAHIGDRPVVMDHIVKKFLETHPGEFYPVNNDQPDDRTQQAKHQAQFKIIFCEEHVCVNLMVAYFQSFSSLAFRT